MTRVLVIDDHPIVLQGCRQLLEMPVSTRSCRRKAWPTASACIERKSPT